MKIKTLVSTSILTSLLCGSAMALPYSVKFDPDGSGATYYDPVIYGWDGEIRANEADQTMNGTQVGIITTQNIAGAALAEGDTFSETLTVTMLNGVDELGNPVASWNSGFGLPFDAQYNDSLLLDISLSGHIENYSDGGTPTTAGTPTSILDDSFTSVFDSGSATLYLDNDGNDDFTVGDTIAATFGLISASDFIVSDSVFSDGSGLITLGFEFLTVNDDDNFFSTAPGESDLATLISNDFLLAFGQTSLFSTPDAPANVQQNGDAIELGWGAAGLDMNFEAVPEPTTMLLFGTGLMGLAAVGRRKKRS